MVKSESTLYDSSGRESKIIWTEETIFSSLLDRIKSDFNVINSQKKYGAQWKFSSILSKITPENKKSEQIHHELILFIEKLESG